MSEHHTLLVARALIADPETWLKGESYRRLNGRDCYCITGALNEATRIPGRYLYDQYRGRAFKALRAAIGDGLLNGDALSAWNDHPRTTHADVLGALDAAIEATRGAS